MVNAAMRTWTRPGVRLISLNGVPRAAAMSLVAAPHAGTLPAHKGKGELKGAVY